MSKSDRLLGAISLMMASALAVAATVMLGGPERADWAAGMDRLGGLIALLLSLLAALPGIWLLMRGRPL